MRNVDSKEYQNNPDRPEFVKIKDSYELLVHPTRRKAYDAVYNILRTIQRSGAERRAARGVDSKRTIASHLRLDQPTTFQDGSPARDHCVVRAAGLPPQVTAVDLVKAIADISPVGRVIECRLMPPLDTRVERSAIVEFANDDRAQHFGLLAHNNHFYVLGKRKLFCTLIQPLPVASLPPPRDATRVFVLDGPRDHKLMTVSALGQFLDRKIEDVRDVQESFTMRESINGPNSVTIECIFTTWRRGAKFARAALRREYPELSVTYGRDPCE